MVKGFGWRWASAGTLFFVGNFLFQKGRKMQKPQKKEKDVIAYRKSCKALGTGLSHYILMDKKAK